MARMVPVFKTIRPRDPGYVRPGLKLGPGHPAWDYALSQFLAEGVAAADVLAFANASEPGERPWLDELVAPWGLVTD